MLVRRCSDIVRRATQIATLENSNFISWDENESLINDEYVQFYQWLINRGDKSFLKAVTVATAPTNSYVGRYTLPSDFYQMNDIQTFPECVPILRKAESESYDSCRYDIAGGELYLFGVPYPNVIMHYFPQPLTLAYPRPSATYTLATAFVSGTAYYILNSENPVTQYIWDGSVTATTFTAGTYYTCSDTDTLLDFPNQMYFTLLANYLAIAYKIKQGADPTAVNLQLEQQKATFFDSLSSDDSGYVRIKNVDPPRYI